MLDRIEQVDADRFLGRAYTDVNGAVDSDAAFDLSEFQDQVRYNAEVPNPADPSDPLLYEDSLVLDEWSLPKWADVDGELKYVRSDTSYTYDAGAPNGGINPETDKPFSLPTSVTVGIVDADNFSLDPDGTLAPDLETVSVTEMKYDPIDGASPTGPSSGWILGGPTQLKTVMPNSADTITSKTLFDGKGRITETREPLSNGADAGTTRTVYYSAGSNSLDSACGNAPQWAGRVCWTGPAAEPTQGADIPDNRITGYSKWGLPFAKVETSGHGSTIATRTSTYSYFADGRVNERAVESTGLSESVPVQRVRAVWDNNQKKITGLQSVASGQVTSSVIAEFDKWGREVSSTDSFGSISTTTYVQPGLPGAGHVLSVQDETGTTTYSYDGTDADGLSEHRGIATGMFVSGLGQFQAAYDADLNVVTEVMPGGIVKDSEFDNAGNQTSIAYSGKVGDSQGSWMAFARSYDGVDRVSTEYTPEGGTDLVAGGFSKAYSYDRAGRLSRVASVATDGLESLGCTVREYEFDKQGNRTSLTQASGSTCVDAAGGAGQTYAFDSFSRQLSGSNATGQYEYDAFGRQTSIPGSDAPGVNNQTIEIEYYDTDAVKSLTTGQDTTVYSMDPYERRVQETKTGANPTVI